VRFLTFTCTVYTTLKSRRKILLFLCLMRQMKRESPSDNFEEFSSYYKIFVKGVADKVSVAKE
jgi:hypothetical protein